MWLFEIDFDEKLRIWINTQIFEFQLENFITNIKGMRNKCHSEFISESFR
jgi:hypothetical protein